MKSGMYLIMLSVKCAVSCSLCLVFSFWVLFSLILYCSLPLKNYLWRSLRPRMKTPSSQGVWRLLLVSTGSRDTTSSWPLHTQFATWGVLDLPGDDFIPPVHSGTSHSHWICVPSHLFLLICLMKSGGYFLFTLTLDIIALNRVPP